MRLSLVLVLLALPAFGSNVLVVPDDEARARGVGDIVVEVLSNAGVTLKLAGPKAPITECTRQDDPAERRKCLSEFGTRATVSSVLFVAVTEDKKVITATLELVAQATGKLVKAITIKATTAKWEKQAGTQLKVLKGPINAQRFVAREIAREIPATKTGEPEPKPEPGEAKVEEPKAEEPAAKEEPAPEKAAVAGRDESRREPEADDRPVNTTLTPTDERPEVSVEDSEPTHAGAWTVTGVSLAAVAVATTVGLIGLAGKSRLDSAPNGLSPMSYGQATALQSASNTQLTVALIVGLVAIASGATAGLLWGYAQ